MMATDNQKRIYQEGDIVTVKGVPAKVLAFRKDGYLLYWIKTGSKFIDDASEEDWELTHISLARIKADRKERDEKLKSVLSRILNGQGYFTIMQTEAIINNAFAEVDKQ